MTVGKKILVVGVSASGKSHFARELAARTGLPLTHVTHLCGNRVGNTLAMRQPSRYLMRLVSDPHGSLRDIFRKKALPFVLERADTIIYLKYGRLLNAWRYFKRCWKHRRDPRPELEGSPDSFNFMFLVRILQKKEVYYLNKLLAAMPDTSKVIRLQSPQQAEAFLKEVRS